MQLEFQADRDFSTGVHFDTEQSSQNELLYITSDMMGQHHRSRRPSNSRRALVHVGIDAAPILRESRERGDLSRREREARVCPEVVRHVSHAHRARVRDHALAG
jgi:hypothetical protein